MTPLVIFQVILPFTVNSSVEYFNFKDQIILEQWKTNKHELFANIEFYVCILIWFN